MLGTVPERTRDTAAGTGVDRDNHGVDAIDREILGQLSRNARISYRDLGASVGLSPNAAADRVRRLVETRVIRAFTIDADPGADGSRLTVLIDVRLGPEATAERFETAVARLPAVAEAVHVTGNFDYHLRASVPDAAQLDALIRQLKRDAGVAESSTRVVLRSVLARGRRPN
jgi:Lrp/AsnC family leucine-responsive transcriptional regulator